MTRKARERYYRERRKARKLQAKEAVKQLREQRKRELDAWPDEDIMGRLTEDDERE